MFGWSISIETMLTGSDLLSKVKELGDVSKSDLATACGYVSDKKDGGQRVSLDGRGFIETESGGALEEPWRQVGGVCVGESF